MGLDMYLSKKTFIGANYDHRKVSGKIEIKINGEPVDIDFKKVTEIVESVGYWRKANQIHNWFVENVQDGNDDCEEYYVSYEQLMELKNLCKEVLKTKDTDLLPPTSGFFFGSTDTDEYYFQDLRDTVKILDNIKKSDGYHYQASW